MHLLSVLPFYNERSLISQSPTHTALDQSTGTAISPGADEHLSATKAKSNHLAVMHLNTQSMTSTFGELSLLTTSSTAVTTLNSLYMNPKKTAVAYMIFVIFSKPNKGGDSPQK